MSDQRSFFSELKRRNVYKVAVAYLVASWLLIQIATQVFPFFEIPNWAVRLVVLLLILGFPAALIFSWAFEITPEGIKRESEIGPGKSVTRKTGRKLVGLSVVLAVIAASLFVYQLVRPQAEPQKSVATQPLGEAKAAPISPKSVAVLAFDNLSDDKGSEYFSDGISEELLTGLQKIPGLRVAARTSSFSFKGKSATAQEIGDKLGVANLVEGSVRKAGETVRIAARLTKTTTGDEIWSENYTRDLKDVFAVQTELAATIVEQLRGQLTGGGDAKAKAVIQEQVQMAEKGGTKNVEAHQHYLQGRFYLESFLRERQQRGRRRISEGSRPRSRLRARLGGTGRGALIPLRLWRRAGRASFEAHLASAREAMEKRSPRGQPAGGVVCTGIFNLILISIGKEQRIRCRRPTAGTRRLDAFPRGRKCGACQRRCRTCNLYRNAVALDPVNPKARSFLAVYHARTRQFAEAQTEYARVIELSPASPWSHAGLGLTFLLLGKFEEAASAAHEDAAGWARLYITALARWSQKRIPEADAALADLIQNYAIAACQIGGVYAYREEKDQAFEWLERARRQRDSGLMTIRGDPIYENLHGDPRWDALLRTMGLADDQLK